MIFPTKIELNELVMKQPSIRFAQQLKNLVLRNQTEFQYILSRHLTTLDKARKDLESRWEKWRKGEQFCYFLFKEGKLIGLVAIKMHTGRSVGEISYYLDKEQTGHGYITKTVQELEQLFFEQGGHRCEILCNEKNKRSCAIAERLNYQLDGVMREYELIDGIYCGFRVYSKLSSD